MMRASRCVIVKRLMAERARRFLVSSGLLDRSLKPVPVRGVPTTCEAASDVDDEGSTLDFVVFPVKRALSKGEEEMLREIVGFLQVCSFSFPVREVGGRLVDVLRGYLPDDALPFVPRSYDIVGDIAVLELAPEVWDFRNVIGEAVLKVNKHVHAVFAKGGRVNGTYRVRRLVHIAGETRTVTFHRENGCVFKVDIEHAYFSPRLSGEHARVATQVRRGEVVVDLFAGVGPFAILIAKRYGGIVHAIDLNPFAVELLKENIRLNKVSNAVFPYLGDARLIVESYLMHVADRVIMNLPGMTYRFIDVACLAMKRDGGIVHYYQFGRGNNACEDAVETLEKGVRGAGRRVKKVLTVRKVRSTAPREWQIVVDAVIE